MMTIAEKKKFIEENVPKIPCNIRNFDDTIWQTLTYFQLKHLFEYLNENIQEYAISAAEKMYTIGYEACEEKHHDLYL